MTRSRPVAEPVNESVETRVSRLLGDRVVRARTLSGGMISDVVRIEFEQHEPVVVKYASDDGRLSLEANMLRHLRDVSDLPVPEVLHYDDDLVVLEAMPGDHLGPAAEAHCAVLTADLHKITNASFGFGGPTLNGDIVLESPWVDRWIPFFREHRLVFAMNLAVQNGRLPAHLRPALEAIIDRTDDLLVEPARPALLHGDLWNANVLAEGDRVTAFLDPSACYGDPELEIAYVDAFGTLGPEFVRVYQVHHPLSEEFWAVRRHVYALYPLLMHVYYFGDRFLPNLENTIDAVKRQM